MQGLWCIERRLSSFGLGFRVSHERNCNFLVTIVACELDFVIIRNICFLWTRRQS